MSKEKRKSFILTGSPIIPINASFHSNSNINQHLKKPSYSSSSTTTSPSSTTSSTSPRVLSSSGGNGNGDPIVQHHPDFISQIRTTSLIKLLLIGDAGVGKSALIIGYCDDIFEENQTKATIGVDLKVKVVNVDGSYFKTVIWDTAGQERYRNVIPSLYKGTNGVLLTYDVTDMNSFKGLNHWIQECYDYCDLSRTLFYLVGNKLDQSDDKVVSKDDIKKLLNNVREKYSNFKINAVFEVSAKYSNITYGLFDTVIKDLVQNRCFFDEQRLRNKRSIDLSTARDQQQNNCCSY